MLKSLDRYLSEKFPGLELESPLFYNADIGIRFEIGDPDPSVSDEKYREQVRFRATQLFNHIHDESDELFIVLYLTVRRNSKPHKLNVFNKGVKSKHILKKLNCISVVRLEEDDDQDEWISSRYVLGCGVSDIKPATFLFSEYSIFFINSTRNTIFYLYDSRGLDIVSNAKEPLQDLYDSYNPWILDYDRETIDSTFKKRI